METEYDDDETALNSLPAGLPSGVRQTNSDRGAQVIQIDSSKHVSAVALCAAICGFAGALSVWAAYQASITERETRMLQNYVVEVDAKLIHAGFIEPKETWTAQRKEKH